MTRLWEFPRPNERRGATQRMPSIRTRISQQFAPSLSFPSLALFQTALLLNHRVMEQRSERRGRREGEASGVADFCSGVQNCIRDTLSFLLLLRQQSVCKSSPSVRPYPSSSPFRCQLSLFDPPIAPLHFALRQKREEGRERKP